MSLAVSTVFSLASTAPAYSLAVTVGLLAAMVGEHAPLLLAVSAVPVVLVVLAFGEPNAAEPDCGTCYAWTSKPFGRHVGFLGGWVVIAACVLVMANLMQAAAIYAYTVLGLDSLAGSRPAQAAAGIAALLLMAALAAKGITLAVRTQVVLFTVEALLLVAFAVRAALVGSAARPAGRGCRPRRDRAHTRHGRPRLPGRGLPLLGLGLLVRRQRGVRRPHRHPGPRGARRDGRARRPLRRVRLGDHLVRRRRPAGRGRGGRRARGVRPPA